MTRSATARKLTTTSDSDLPARNSALDLLRVQLVTREATPEAGPLWDPATRRSERGVVTTDDVRARTRPPEALPAELEEAIIAVITRPLAAGESHQLGNANRERELCGLLARLDVVQAHHLGRRLDVARANDPLVAAFQRLVLDRRQRVRAFLADARRRVAIAHARAA